LIELFGYKLKKIVVSVVATKDEELNKQLKQIEKLTAEQILSGIRVWMGDAKADPKYTLEKNDNPESKK
jgi:hypothetical protein